MGILFGANPFAEEADQAAPAGTGHQEKISRTGRRGLLKSCHCVHGDSIGYGPAGGSAEFVNCAADFVADLRQINVSEGVGQDEKRGEP